MKNITEKLREIACKRPMIRSLMPEKCGCELETVEHEYSLNPSITNKFKCKPRTR